MVALGAALLALLIASAALAQGPTPPHTFFGGAGDVSIDGNTAPAGTEIVAMSGGEEIGRDTIGADGWRIDVPAGTGEVMFSVNDMMVDVSYPVSQAGFDRITLAAMSSAMDSGDDSMMGDDDSLEGDDDSMDGGDDSMMGDDDSLEGGDDSMMGDDDSLEGGDDSMMDEDPPSDTVGGVNGIGSTGTGGLADRGSSAALWGSIGGALALTALLLGGFAVRRRRAQS